MFITLKRHEREKQDLLGANSRLADAILKNSDQGLFLLDAKGRITMPVSRALTRLFRRPDFVNLSLEKLLAPLVSAKTLTSVRAHLSSLLNGSWNDGVPVNVLKDLEVRLPNTEGSADTAHYRIEFDPIEAPNKSPLWLVRVTDITAQMQTLHEVEELRNLARAQGEVLRGVLQMGRGRFGSFVKKADDSMKAIATVLKKSAREEAAFRGKLEETLAEVDRIRREAAAFKLAALEHAARVFEDALHELRSRPTLSGSDFLPLAVKLDDLYNQFALVKSMTLAAAARDAPALAAANAARVTDNGTQIIEAPRFAAAAAAAAAQQPPAVRVAMPPPAGSLDNTLQALTTHIADLEKKQVVLESSGLHGVPPRYQSVVKNVAIQLIRNAIMHGIETPAAREAAGKPLHGTLHLEFRLLPDCFELLFEDDGRGLDPEQMRSVAVQRGVITEEAAARLRDREAIKLIFKTRFTTLEAGDPANPHGIGMSLVRRHIHESGGKIALASLPGHETRFKITLPALALGAAAGDTAAGDQPQVA